MEAIKINFKNFWGYEEEHYLLIAETAESNLINDRGGHDYHRWIYSSGTFYDIMKEVCQSAYYFEDGSNKWKPNAKTAEGFIRTCKKALEEAKETDGKMPYYLSGIIYWEENRSKFNEAIEIFSGKENISIKQRYSYRTIETEDIETYIKAKQTLDNMRVNYLESEAHNVKSFKEWFEENKRWYKYFKEEVTA
jgi:hypothetical protein